MLYGYEKPRVFLSIEDVLSRVSQEDVFKHLLGFRPKEGIRVRSPFRADKSGDAFFTKVGGRLRFADFADPIKTTRDCVDAVMELKHLGMQGALNYINDTFALGIGGDAPAEIVNVLTSVVKEEWPMDYYPRLFGVKDKAFWFDRYGITRNQLIQDRVYALVWYKLYSFKRKDFITIRPNGLSYAMTDFRPGHLKAYCPFAEHNRRFATNLSNNDIGNLANLSLIGDELVITKSYKDHRVLRNHGIKNCVYLQNEGMMPSEEMLADLSLRFNTIHVLFDNDSTGLKASLKLSQAINNISSSKAFSSILPKGPKDPSDLVHQQGSEALYAFLQTSLSNETNTSFLDAPFEAPF